MGHSKFSNSAVLNAAAFVPGCDASGGPAAPTFEATGTAAVLPGDRCSDLTVEIRGTGRATHLGRLTNDQSHCATPTSLAFTDGLFTLTAANGDQLRGTYSGDFVPHGPPLFNIVRFTFTGGTGRFAGATGGGNATGVQNLRA